MVGPNDKAKGAGPQGRGGGGFSFDDREGGKGRGRGGRDGDRGDRRGGKGGGGAAYRVVNELSALEKALTKGDYAAQKQSLDDIVKGVKGLRLKSLNDLDMGSRGKLLTTLMRVARQPKKDVAPAEAPPAEAPPAEAAPADAPAEGAAPAEAAPAEAPKPPAAPVTTWSDVLFTTGLVWSAANETERANAAFESAGRKPTASELAALATPEAPVADDRGRRGDRRDGSPGKRGERRERGDRPERRDRPERGPRGDKERRFEPAPAATGNWALDARNFEEAGRTRDAGRLHEANQSFTEASRLYEIGGDFKSALRNAARAKDSARITALSAKLTPDEVTLQLEKAEAWELLMELYVQKGDFAKVAALYERALQFDQAALAWERAGKLSVARRCYEKAKDFAAANRVRDLEVTKLVERGDRLGAATILMGVGRSADAIELLKPLPGPKAYAFMLKLKLNAEAAAFAAEALAKAEAEGNLQSKARWLETMGKHEAAAEAYLAANRKDRASAMFEHLGQFAKAAELAEAAGQLDKAQALFGKAGDAANVERVKALPRPEPKPAAEEAKDEADGEAMVPPPAEAAPVTPTASA
ncbi:MAG: DEAD/DEAH box helicase [Myxococcaceae bacterium]|nr:DEAD/DEAH box helicase [Myxococcaceae bacterium]